MKDKPYDTGHKHRMENWQDLYANSWHCELACLFSLGFCFWKRSSFNVIISKLLINQRCLCSLISSTCWMVCLSDSSDSITSPFCGVSLACWKHCSMLCRHTGSSKTFAFSCHWKGRILYLISSHWSLSTYTRETSVQFWKIFHSQFS